MDSNGPPETEESNSRPSVEKMESNGQPGGRKEPNDRLSGGSVESNGRMPIAGRPFGNHMRIVAVDDQPSSYKGIQFSDEGTYC